jgi:hypothetical protein
MFAMYDPSFLRDYQRDRLDRACRARCARRLAKSGEC